MGCRLTHTIGRRETLPEEPKGTGVPVENDHHQMKLVSPEEESP